MYSGRLIGWFECKIAFPFCLFHVYLFKIYLSIFLNIFIFQFRFKLKYIYSLLQFRLGFSRISCVTSHLILRLLQCFKIFDSCKFFLRSLNFNLYGGWLGEIQRWSFFLLRVYYTCHLVKHLKETNFLWKERKGFRNVIWFSKSWTFITFSIVFWTNRSKNWQR